MMPTQDISFKEAGKFEETRYEKMHIEVFDHSANASKVVAKAIANLILEKQKLGEKCVLGLATGSSPIKVYEELVRIHRTENLSFFNVVTFNLDEYFPMNQENTQSYYHFMHQHLFDHVDIQPDHIHIPNGQLDMNEVYQYCIDYELKIKSLGGIDFQLLGIGRTCHIGFNEPGSHINSGTRIITLDPVTRIDAASDFNGLQNVPRKAITMGINTIMNAKRIVLLAWGEHKSQAIFETVEGIIDSEHPATYLQRHSNTTLVLDKEAAGGLTRFKTPWLVKECIWTLEMKKKAVVWLSQQTNKPILKLTDKDFNDNGMSGLLAEYGSSYQLNIEMFNQIQHTITGWPGGKPNADDSKRPERATPTKKKVLLFSPHPDDDVISMGATFSRLIDQGHEVHVAYQTSGNIAVTDDEAIKFAEVAKELNDSKEFDHIIDFLSNKKENAVDSPAVLKLKGLIRKRESFGATRFLGLNDENVHFLNLPFYETGLVKKNPMGNDDINIVQNLIESIQPHQIYVAGDLADPHGTHKVCLDIVFEAIDRLKEESFMDDCWVWMYRGAWHEWGIHEIDMAVPISPDQLEKKRNAILFHQSQKDKVMFQGDDKREFWMRAQDRNRSTAKIYDQLGLAEYEAIEAFRRYFF